MRKKGYDECSESNNNNEVRKKKKNERKKKNMTRTERKQIIAQQLERPPIQI